MDVPSELRRLLERLNPFRRTQGGYCIICQREYRGSAACPNRLRHGNSRIPLPPQIRER